MKKIFDIRWLASGAIVAALLLLPLHLHRFPYQMFVLTSAFFYAILSSSWALLAGIAGQFSFAHVAFVGIGAYTSGLLGKYLGVPPFLGILIGTLTAGLVGVFIGFLCLRLRGAYLALFTIAFSEILRIIVLSEYQITEGSTGLEMKPLYPHITPTAQYYITLVMLLVTMAFMYWLAGSRFGLFIKAMREDEDAAAAMGVDTVRYKVLIFAITSTIVGLAGGIFYHQVGIITPNIMEILQMSLIIAFAVIGGIESLMGAAIGAFLCRIALEWLREINILGWHIEPGIWRYAAFGVLLMLTLRFARNGLLYPVIDRLFLRKAREEAVLKRRRAKEVEA
ncbi:MAG TPA: branched-chain amino acid ABC transporter permease [Chloroflexi bacterium]|nr:branched-chain amino acid ABC transporter permease [Chloroflexota bacterium]